jgi:hypothetical protein
MEIEIEQILDLKSAPYVAVENKEDAAIEKKKTNYTP